MTIGGGVKVNRINFDSYAISDRHARAFARIHNSFFRLIVLGLTLLLALPSIVVAADLAVTSGHVLTPSATAPLAVVYDVTANNFSRVSFTASDGVESFEKSFPAFAKVHSVPLFGFKPDRTYEITVTLTEFASGNTLELGTLFFTTDPLPADFPPLEVLVSDPSNMEPGYILLPVRNRGPRRWGIHDVARWRGDVVWYQRLNPGDLRQLPTATSL